MVKQNDITVDWYYNGEKAISKNSVIEKDTSEQINFRFGGLILKKIGYRNMNPNIITYEPTIIDTDGNTVNYVANSEDKKSEFEFVDGEAKIQTVKLQPKTDWEDSLEKVQEKVVDGESVTFVSDTIEVRPYTYRFILKEWDI